MEHTLTKLFLLPVLAFCLAACAVPSAQTVASATPQRKVHRHCVYETGSHLCQDEADDPGAASAAPVGLDGTPGVFGLRASGFGHGGGS
jgi:hypothetical protein